MKNSRDENIDTVAGLMILWMINLHIQKLSGFALIPSRYMPFLPFFMMWFFYKSGMYHKVLDFKTIAHTSIKRLLIPYAIFSFIGIISGTIISLYQNESLIDFYIGSVYQFIVMGGVFSNMPVWFLLSLFCVKIVFNHFIIKNVGKVCIGTSIVIAFLLAMIGVAKPPYFGNICLGLFFYGLGYYFKQIQFKQNIFLISIFLYFLIYIFHPSNIDVRANLCNLGTYLGAVVGGVFAIIVINNLSRCSISLRPLTYLGQHSMVYYLCHWIILKQVQTYVSASPKELYVIMCLACIMILPVIDRIICMANIRWIVGEKDR